MGVIKVNFKDKFDQDTEFIVLKMEIDMKVSGKMGNKKGREFIHRLKVTDMKENLSKEKKMEEC